MPDKNIDKALKDKFLCQTKFTKDIETLVKNDSDFNYIDAIVHYCEENKIELESVPKLISKPLKEKLKGLKVHGTQLSETYIPCRLPL